MPLFEEELLEPLPRILRFIKAFKEIPKGAPISIADLGCGPKIRAYFAMKKSGIEISHYYGIDPLLSKQIIKDFVFDPSIKLVPKAFNKIIPLPDSSVDIIISLAVLEHIDSPKHILLDIHRVLKSGGKAIITTPTPLAQKILEFMSYRLGVLSRREIEEHQNYFTKEDLISMLQSVKGILVSHTYFEFGLNNLLIIEKK